MSTYVLVHGAWHGGWCWKKVAPLLRAAGHDVFTPTLTGLGERVHLLTPEVDLRTHIQDVLGVLQYEDLQQVVLVGHSYGGMVITGVAERAADRLAHLVYVDAWVPTDAQSQLDAMPADRVSRIREQAKEEGDGWRVPPLPLEAFGLTVQADKLWATSRVGAQPLATFEQSVRITDPAAQTLRRTYIACTTGPLRTMFRMFAERAQREPGWRYYELETGHDAMITAPRELSDLLIGVV